MNMPQYLVAFTALLPTTHKQSQTQVTATFMQAAIEEAWITKLTAE